MKRGSELWRKNFRLLKLMHEEQRSAIPLYLLWALVDGIQPYIFIIMGAMILDSLLLSAYEQALLQMLSMMGAQFLLSLLSAVLSRYAETISMSINRLCNAKICLKTISLDYATFADKKNLEEFEAADYNTSRNGGFGMLLLAYHQLVKGMITFLVALVLLLRLCLSSSAYEGAFHILISPPVSLCLLGMVTALLAVLYERLVSYVSREHLKLYYEEVEYDQKMSFFANKLFSDPEYAKEIRMYSMQGMLYERWNKLLARIYRFYRGMWGFERMNRMVSSLLNDAVLLFAYLFVILKAFASAVSIGSFTQYIGGVQQMNLSLKQIVEALNKIRLYVSYLSFYITFMEKKNLLDTGELPVEKRDDNEFEIEFHDVSFRYPHSEVYSLRHLSLKLDMKRRFAVVGRNGAGKTTFIKLLCRMYDVSEGYITLNGVDIRKYAYQEYLNLFAAVFQDFALFSFSLKDNISCGAESEEERMWQVLEQAGMKEKVQRLPAKLSTLLYHDMGEGVELSGGEAQKLAIARALYKDAPLVILDEPTAALDPLSEAEIYARFDSMVKDKTSMYISHRMSSCRFCDEILVFDEGALVQRGSHEALMKEESGVYASLWKAQAKYYAQEAKEDGAYQKLLV